MQPSDIDWRTNQQADRECRRIAAFDGEPNACGLRSGEPWARCSLTGREPDQVDSACLASQHQLDCDIDLRERDLERVRQRGRVNR
jgi:hypothetical protein